MMATGIVEKGNSGLFNNEIEFNGKYATMVRFLKEELGLFGTFREAYVIASIVGFIHEREITEGKEKKVQAASIFPNELNKRKPDLRFIYRLIMLLKEEPEFTLEDYKNRTFKDDPEENSDILKGNMEIFNSYACGGIEYIYELFENCVRTEETVDVLYEFLHRFSVEVGLEEEENELPDFEPEFN